MHNLGVFLDGTNYVNGRLVLWGNFAKLYKNYLKILFHLTRNSNGISTRRN